MKHLRYHQEISSDLINAGSLICGGALTTYIAVKLGNQSGFGGSIKLYMTFVGALLTTWAMHGCSRYAARGILDISAGLLIVAIFSSQLMMKYAVQVGVDFNVLFCVMLAWLTVPTVALISFFVNKKSDEHGE